MVGLKIRMTYPVKCGRTLTWETPSSSRWRHSEGTMNGNSTITERHHEEETTFCTPQLRQHDATCLWRSILWKIRNTTANSEWLKFTNPLTRIQEFHNKLGNLPCNIITWAPQVKQKGGTCGKNYPCKRWCRKHFCIAGINNHTSPRNWHQYYWNDVWSITKGMAKRAHAIKRTTKVLETWNVYSWYTNVLPTHGRKEIWLEKRTMLAEHGDQAYMIERKKGGWVHFCVPRQVAHYQRRQHLLRRRHRAHQSPNIPPSQPLPKQLCRQGRSGSKRSLAASNTRILGLVHRPFFLLFHSEALALIRTH